MNKQAHFVDVDVTRNCALTTREREKQRKKTIIERPNIINAIMIMIIINKCV